MIEYFQPFFFNYLPSASLPHKSSFLRQASYLVLIVLPRFEICLDNTVVASRWANVVVGVGSVKSSIGTYIACTEVMEPLFVVIRSCKPPISVAKVGWYQIAEGIRPSEADTSEFAYVK